MTYVTWGLSLMALKSSCIQLVWAHANMPFIPIDMRHHFNVAPLPSQGGERSCDDLTTTTLSLVYRLYTPVHITHWFSMVRPPF